MAGKKVKILTDAHVNAALRAVRRNRHATRDRVIILLSVKAGLRAGEIAKLTWPMVCNARGHIGRLIELHDVAAKMRGGPCIPLHLPRDDRPFAITTAKFQAGPSRHHNGTRVTDPACRTVVT